MQKTLFRRVTSRSADQHPPVVGTPVAHHLASALLQQMRRGKTPIKDLFEVAQVFPGYMVILRIGNCTVNRPTISIDNHCNVFGPFHPALDFKTDHSCLNQLRHEFNGLKITRAQQIFTDFTTRQCILSFAIQQPVRQTAWLGATASIATAAADHAGHQALARITNAQSAMNERLDLTTSSAADCFDFRQRQFPRQNHPVKTVVGKQIDGRQIVGSHLGAGVNRQIRRNMFGDPGHADILQNRRISANIIQSAQIVLQDRQFCIIKQCIDCHIYLYA